MRNIDIFTELSEHVQLTIHSCKEQTHPCAWSESKVHQDYDIWFIREGVVIVQTETGTYRATAGDFIIHYPNAPYSARTETEGCRFIYMHFDFGLGEHFRILDDFALSGIVPGALLTEEASLFLTEFQRYQRRESMASLRMKGTLHLLLAQILSLYGSGSYEGQFLKGTTSGKRNVASLQPVITHIHEQIGRTLSISELADIAGVTEKYFIRFFKRVIGVTPGKYIHQLKMNRARDYIHQQTYSVKQIAELLGYPDAYTFSKSFKKHYRVPPSKFL